MAMARTVLFRLSLMSSLCAIAAGQASQLQCVDEDDGVCLLQGNSFLEKSVSQEADPASSPMKLNVNNDAALLDKRHKRHKRHKRQTGDSNAVHIHQTILDVAAQRGVQPTANCPAVCINCKQGWGSASVDLVNGICTQKCGNDFGNCVRVSWSNGVDCTGCTELAQAAAPPAPTEASAEGDGTPEGSNFRALPKRSCDEETKALEWYSYGSRAAAEEACLAEGCGRLGTKQEQSEYGSLCAALWSSDAKGYHMIGTHNGCGHDGWNGAASRTTLGAFCAECPDCPASEEESGTPEEESGTQAEPTSQEEEEIVANRCGPLFQDHVCDCNGDFPTALYCNERNGWCGSTDTHRDAQESTTYDCVPIPDNRCGPLYQDHVCDCSGDFPKALYCNERNGWCGSTDAHRDAQASTTYDCVQSEEESGTPEEESGGVQPTADCPAVCINCKQGWGSASVDLVNGICTQKCGNDFGNCVRESWSNGVDCTGCTELAQAAAPPAPIEASAEGDGTPAPPKGRLPVSQSSSSAPTLANRTYRMAVALPLSLQDLTADAKEELIESAENVLCAREDVTCTALLRERSDQDDGVSFIQKRGMHVIVIVIVVSATPDSLLSLPDPTIPTMLAALTESLLSSLNAFATDPELQSALDSGDVEGITSGAGTVWKQGTNAENAPFSCLTADGTYADHLDADHSGGPGDIWYGTLSEAKERCDANVECVVLHDWDGDDNDAWRACRSVTYNEGGPAHTMVMI